MLETMVTPLKKHQRFHGNARSMFSGVRLGLTSFFILQAIFTALYLSPVPRKASDEFIIDAPAPTNTWRRQERAKIAWLMSFPNSGTTYTLANMEHMTGMTTATNYAAEVASTVLHPLNERNTGPFLADPLLPVPEYVLTKTHCTGYSDELHHSFGMHDMHTFNEGCRNSVIDYTCSQESRPYDFGDVKKFVHLIRDPFDNIVARMHLGTAERVKAGVWSKRQGSKYDNSLEGLRAWCEHVDGIFHDDSQLHSKVRPHVANKTIDDETMELLKRVPCHSEWFRYVQWHNLATQLFDHPVDGEFFRLYYEDYSTRFNETVTELAVFLDQPIVRDPKPFVSGKSYHHLFTLDEKAAVADLIKTIATPDCWKLLRRYFVDSYADARDDEAGVATAEGKPAPPMLVWLLAFPQSGVQYTLNNFNAVTGMKTASHHWEDAGVNAQPLWPNVMHSPLLVGNASHGVPSNVLTKNFCSRHCRSCQPVQDGESFSNGCHRVTTNNDGSVEQGEYGHELVSAAVVQIRNPFDVMRSRATRGLQTIKSELGLSDEDILGLKDQRQGLMQWCQLADAHFEAHRPTEPPRTVREEPNPFYRFIHHAMCPAGLFESQERYSLLQDEKPVQEYILDMKIVDEAQGKLPCYSDWVRLIQWHNYALQMTERVPTRVLYFEEYLSDFNNTTEGLATFVEAASSGEPLPLNKERASHNSLYTRAESIVATNLVRSLASPELWKLMEHYFIDETWLQNEEHLIGSTKKVNLETKAPVL